MKSGTKRMLGCGTALLVVFIALTVLLQCWRQRNLARNEWADRRMREQQERQEKEAKPDFGATALQLEKKLIHSGGLRLGEMIDELDSKGFKVSAIYPYRITGMHELLRNTNDRTLFGGGLIIDCALSDTGKVGHLLVVVDFCPGQGDGTSHIPASTLESLSYVPVYLNGKSKGYFYLVRGFEWWEDNQSSDGSPFYTRTQQQWDDFGAAQPISSDAAMGSSP